jgi:hypothetical protein
MGIEGKIRMMGNVREMEIKERIDNLEKLNRGMMHYIETLERLLDDNDGESIKKIWEDSKKGLNNG